MTAGQVGTSGEAGLPPSPRQAGVTNTEISLDKRVFFPFFFSS